MLLYLEWPKDQKNFLEPAVIKHYVRIIASAGDMKANIADFINQPKTNLNYSGGRKLSNFIKRRNGR